MIRLFDIALTTTLAIVKQYEISTFETIEKSLQFLAEQQGKTEAVHEILAEV